MANAFTVKMAKEQPDGIVLPGVTGILSEVKPLRTVNTKNGPVTVQDFKLQDGDDFIYGAAWGFFDMTPHFGKQIVLVSNKAGNNRVSGVQLKDKPSKTGQVFKNLSVTSAATLHSPDTYSASGGIPVQATIPVQPPVQQQPQQPVYAHPPQVMAGPAPAPLPEVKKVPLIQGITVGMAINNAVQIYLVKASSGINAEQFIWEKASAIIRVAQRLEKGDLYAYPDPIAEQAVTRVAQDTTRIMKPDEGSFKPTREDFPGDDDKYPF